MKKLVEQTCQTCEGGVIPFSQQEVETLLKNVSGWKALDGFKSIQHQYTFSGFQSALDFVNGVGFLAEAEGHHPDIHLVQYKQVVIELNTHAINGLSNNDLIMAAKINELYDKKEDI